MTNEEIQERIGRVVKMARVAKGMTQRQLAEAIAKSHNFVFCLESGKTDPGLIALKNIANVLEIHLTLLLMPVLEDFSEQKEVETTIRTMAK